MATVRGRDQVSMGGLFTSIHLSGSTAGAPTGHPVMVRMQGVPTMPGYRDRPGKWNVVLWPLFGALLELIRQAKA